MAKIIRLNESDLNKIVRRVLREQAQDQSAEVDYSQEKHPDEIKKELKDFYMGVPDTAISFHIKGDNFEGNYRVGVKLTDMSINGPTITFMGVPGYIDANQEWRKVEPSYGYKDQEKTGQITYKCKTNASNTLGNNRNKQIIDRLEAGGDKFSGSDSEFYVWPQNKTFKGSLKDTTAAYLEKTWCSKISDGYEASGVRARF